MLLKIKVSVEPCLVSVVVLMRGCSGTAEYEAGKEKNHIILTTKKLDYTTADKLLKWSNSLIILETETSKWSKYRIISSAYNEILWLWSWILIDTSDFLMACAKGSRDRQNNKGESGHPCLVSRCKGNGGEIILPVMTDAAGELYNVSEAKTLQNCPHIIPL